MGNWTTIRTLSTTPADSAGAPSAALGVSIGTSTPFVEFRLRDLVLAGSPTSITFYFWRVEGTVVELLGSRTILAADVATQKPVRFVCEESAVYVTIAFTGGAAPTVSGTIEARGLHGVSHSVLEDLVSSAGLKVDASGALPPDAATQTTLAAVLAAEKAGVQSAETALSDGASLSALPIEYKRLSISVGTGAAGWVQLHDHAGTPANGVACYQEVYASGPCTVEFGPVKFAAGAYWCMSSTQRVKTITALTLCCAGVEV